MKKKKHELTQLLKLNWIIASSLVKYNSAFQMALKEQLHIADSRYALWSAWCCLSGIHVTFQHFIYK